MNQFKLVFRKSIIFPLLICLDSPKNSNYISIFTRKSTIKKKQVSIIQNSENWKMLKIEVRLNESKNSIYLFIYRLNIKIQLNLIYLMLLLMKIHLHFLSHKSIRIIPIIFSYLVSVVKSVFNQSFFFVLNKILIDRFRMIFGILIHMISMIYGK